MSREETPNFTLRDETPARLGLANNLLKQYHDRLPVIIEKEPGSNLPELEKKKYLVPHNMTVGNFIVTIRNKIDLANYQSLFIVTREHNYTPASSTTMAEIYQKYHSDDKFLYFYYKSENAFGGIEKTSSLKNTFLEKV